MTVIFTKGRARTRIASLNIEHVPRRGDLVALDEQPFALFVHEVAWSLTVDVAPAAVFVHLAESPPRGMR